MPALPDHQYSLAVFILGEPMAILIRLVVLAMRPEPEQLAR